MGYRGQIDIDVFENGGKYYISEVTDDLAGDILTPMNVGSIIWDWLWIIWKKGESKQESQTMKKESFMMKYNEISILNGGKENAK